MLNIQKIRFWIPTYLLKLLHGCLPGEGKRRNGLLDGKERDPQPIQPKTFNDGVEKMRLVLSRLLSGLGLLTFMLVSACAPTAPAVATQTASPATSTPPAATQTPETAAQPTVQVEAPVTAPVAAATSRGPDLEASDPTTVSLASGGLQLVEFFRFT